MEASQPAIEDMLETASQGASEEATGAEEEESRLPIINPRTRG